MTHPEGGPPEGAGTPLDLFGSLVLDEPDYFAEPPTWAGHIPFAFWLVEALRPSVLVELGTYSGNSYCAFCQAVQRLGLETRCFAIDTWRGDPHTGFYGEEVFRRLRDYHDSRYAAFSRLIRSTFDAACGEFDDGSIDLLHIDGYHTYETVKHDFETWLPKLSRRAVVLLHDTAATHEDFGAAVFWEELRRRYPSFQFLHSHGLGVAGVGEDLPAPVRRLLECSSDPERTAAVRSFYARLGAAVAARWEAGEMRRRLERNAREIAELRRRRDELERKVRELSRELASARAKTAALLSETPAPGRPPPGAQGSEKRLIEAEAGLAAAQEQIRRLEKELERTRLEAEARLERERAAGRAELARLEEKYGEYLRREYRQHQEEISELLERRRAEEEKLRSSLYWRATAPVRWMLDFSEAVLHAGRRLGLRIYSLLKRVSPSWRRHLRILSESPLFDAEYYAAKNPDLRGAALTPVEHYLLYGAAERRNPHPLFDTGYYLDRYFGGSPGPVNPLVDFLLQGARLRRNPHPLFDTHYYTDHTREAAAEGVSPLVHFLATEADEGRRPHPLFDPAYYVRALPGPDQLRENALVHYCENTARAPLRPHPLFDPLHYWKQAPRGTANPLAHYETRGRSQGLEPNPYRLRPISEDVREALARIRLPEDVRAAASALSFPDCADPEVSIVIPVFNHVRWTLRCLNAIQTHTQGIDYEVIVADDGSTDETSELVSAVGGLRYLRCETSVGYLRATNRGAAEARGRYLVLLNNDTVPMPGWLEELRGTFERNPRAGLVGAMLIFPDGRLQEAGAVVWETGFGWHYGQLDEPQKPEYSYLRRTDYCSAACVMLPLALWRRLGGFDEQFAPAYFEDSDLAFRVRESGAEVLYQPLARVVHFANVSYGDGPEATGQGHVAANHAKFVRKWGLALKGRGTAETGRGRLRGWYVQGRVLAANARTPAAPGDAERDGALAYLEALADAGLWVTFAPTGDMTYAGRDTERLQRIGVECLYRPFVKSLEQYLIREGEEIDAVLLLGAEAASEVLPLARRLVPRAKRIFRADVHDFPPDEGVTVGAPACGRLPDEAERALQAAREADLTIVESAAQLEAVRRAVPEARVAVIPRACGEGSLKEASSPAGVAQAIRRVFEAEGVIRPADPRGFARAR